MPENSKKELPIRRKDFFWQLGGASIGIALSGAIVRTLQFLAPNVLFEPPSRFRIGQPEEFSQGSITTRPDQKIYIAHAEKGYFYTMSSVCTHLGCITNYREADKIISCPCHGSEFDLEGNVLSGPAPRPLDRLNMEWDDRGRLIVDVGQKVDQDFVLKG